MTTPAGFRDAYRKFCELGWNGLSKSADFGGQGMPQLVAAAIDEMWNASNMAFELCPMLTGGAIEAIERNGSEALKRIYLPKMVSGEWTGTMNLTEPQAGSDLAAVRAKAVRQADGSYRISGNKIFITYGDHDYTDNIVHLVLARTPDAPPGTKGISLFVVPKFIVNADGSLGAHNDVRCVSLEHKLGIHASPTAVLAFGDHGGAVGYLVGEENRGLEYMFVMMNLARFGVGMQGVGIAERAYQRARDYARDRVQGRVAGAAQDAAASGIIGHPDVRRMLMTMRAYTEAGARARLRHCGGARPRAPAPRRRRAHARARVRRTDDPDRQGLEHGDRAADRLSRRAGARRHGLHRGIRRRAVRPRRAHHDDLRGHDRHPGERPDRPQDRARRRQGDARRRSSRCAASIGSSPMPARMSWRSSARACARPSMRSTTPRAGSSRTGLTDPRAVLAGAGPFLELAGVVCGGAELGRAALVAAKKLAAGEGDADFLRAKLATSRHFADHALTKASGLRDTVVAGAGSVLALTEAQF